MLRLYFNGIEVVSIGETPRLTVEAEEGSAAKINMDAVRVFGDFGTVPVTGTLVVKEGSTALYSFTATRKRNWIYPDELTAAASPLCDNLRTVLASLSSDGGSVSVPIEDLAGHSYKTAVRYKGQGDRFDIGSPVSLTYNFDAGTVDITGVAVDIMD